MNGTLYRKLKEDGDDLVGRLLFEFPPTKDGDYAREYGVKSVDDMLALAEKAFDAGIWDTEPFHFTDRQVWIGWGLRYKGYYPVAYKSERSVKWYRLLAVPWTDFIKAEWELTRRR